VGIIVQTPEQYATSLRKLFPRGPYWDRQFADPNSDCSLFCGTKTGELIRFRRRMSDLHNESAIQTAAETLEEWERVITGSVSVGLEPDQRRALLIFTKAGNITVDVIKEIGRMYGIAITQITFPFRPAFFGFSRFALDRIAGPAAFSVIFIHWNLEAELAKKIFENHYRTACFGFARCAIDRITHPLAASALGIYMALEGDINWELFKTQIAKRVLANYIIYFIFGGA
jgi:hypothetical protein